MAVFFDPSRSSTYAIFTADPSTDQCRTLTIIFGLGFEDRPG
jgi:hypothetical protein